MMYDEPTAGYYAADVSQSFMVAIWSEWKEIFGGAECRFCGHDVSTHTIPERTLDRLNPSIKVVFCSACADEKDTGQVTCFMKQGYRHSIAFLELEDVLTQERAEGAWRSGA